MRACGPAAGSILTCLLCNIYRDKGYYILWDEDLPFDIADRVGVSEGAVSEVVQKAIQVGFFDPSLHKAHKILTSLEIQKRYKAGTAKRQDVEWNDDYRVSSAGNPVDGGRNQVSDTENTQSKVKESKGKESIEIGADAPAPKKSFKEFSEEEFANELKKFKDLYPRELLTEFYRHWKEKSPGGKMRFQLEKTWETELRLQKWARNQQNFKHATVSKASGPGTSEARIAAAKEF